MMIPQNIQLKIVMIMTFLQIRIMKKNKIQEPLNDFASYENNDGDNKTYKKKCGSLQTKERSILLPLFLQSVLNPNSACLYLYAACSYAYCATCFKGWYY